MNFHDAVLVALAFLSEVTGTLSGFGSSTFFVPIAVKLEPFRFVLALTAILHCFGNISKIALFYRNMPLTLLWRLGLPSIFFAGIGALLNSNFSSSLLTRMLGGALILVSLIKFFKKPKNNEIKPIFATTLSAASGLMTGLVGTGGAIRGIALSTLHIEKNAFIALSAGIDIGGDLLRAGIYIYEGYMDWNQWLFIPSLGMAAFLGTVVGKRVLGRMKQDQFERMVSLFVFASGVAMILG